MIIDTLNCDWGQTTALIFSNNVFSPLIYYSHLSSMIISLIIGLYLFIKNPKLPLAQAFFAIVVAFVVWVFSDLVLWADDAPEHIMFFWSLTILFEPVIYALCLYFLIIYLTKNDPSLKTKLATFLLILPTLVFTATKYAIIGFNYSNCDREIFEGILVYYGYFVEIIFVLWIAVLITRKVIHEVGARKKEILMFGGGLMLFLLSFSWGNIVGSLSDNWSLAQYGLFGMPIFIGFLAYNIVKFKLFNVKIVGQNLLVITLWILIASLILITDLFLSQIVITITFIISIIIGLILIKSSSRDRIQLETISSLATSLESLNTSLSDKVAEQTAEIKKSYEHELKARRDLEKLSETKDKFISIAQHNLRIPTTNIKNKIDLVIEKSTDPKLKELLLQTKTSTDHLMDIADDFKSIVKIKLGSQILNLCTSSLYPILNTSLLELKLDAEEMNIKTVFPTDPKSWPDLHIDTNKIKEVLLVILENAIHYNFKNGSIEIMTETKDRNFIMTIKNTGIGISEDENHNLQNRQFYRSDKSKELNPTGMGIGLSLSKGIIEAHHGSLTISSGGADMGAVVTLILPFDFLKING